MWLQPKIIFWTFDDFFLFFWKCRSYLNLSIFRDHDLMVKSPENKQKSAVHTEKVRKYLKIWFFLHVICCNLLNNLLVNIFAQVKEGVWRIFNKFISFSKSVFILIFSRYTLGTKTRNFWAIQKIRTTVCHHVLSFEKNCFLDEKFNFDPKEWTMITLCFSKRHSIRLYYS